MASAKLTVKMPSDAELNRLFATVAVMDRYKVTDKGVRAAAKPILDKARSVVPRSSKSGSSRKQSKSLKKERAGDKPLYKTLRTVVRKYDTGAFAAVGPSWPEGNKVHFNAASKKGFRKVVLWGRHGPWRPYRQEDWLKRASDETLTQQREAMKTSIKKSLDEMMPRR